MAKAYMNAKIALTSREEGVDEGGAPFHWFVATLKDETGSAVEVGTGLKDFSEYEGQLGICVLDVIKRDMKQKIRLVDFIADATFELPEGEIN